MSSILDECVLANLTYLDNFGDRTWVVYIVLHIMPSPILKAVVTFSQWLVRRRLLSVIYFKIILSDVWSSQFPTFKCCSTRPFTLSLNSPCYGFHDVLFWIQWNKVPTCFPKRKENVNTSINSKYRLDVQEWDDLRLCSIMHLNKTQLSKKT